MTLPYALMLVAAVIYAAGALVVKRASDLGVGVWRTAFVANLVAALMFQPLLLLGGTIHPELWWQPLLGALCFVGGQWLTYHSLEHGDVSVATPVLGIKILLVAVLVTAWTGEALRAKLWVAALLATVGIACLNQRGGRVAHHHVGRTVLSAGLAAAAYATFDVLAQQWAPRWGIGRFLPITLGMAALLSFAFVPRFSAPLAALPRTTWWWLLGGTATIGSQSMLFVSSVSYWGHAPQLNVLYSSRGLWSVVLVWLAGHWVSNREQGLGGAVLAWRLGGATLMLAAIALVLA
jgi:drug/metabolite transporter (DMT)-like permease